MQNWRREREAEHLDLPISGTLTSAMGARLRWTRSNDSTNADIYYFRYFRVVRDSPRIGTVRTMSVIACSRQSSREYVTDLTVRVPITANPMPKCEGPNPLTAVL